MLGELRLRLPPPRLLQLQVETLQAGVFLHHLLLQLCQLLLPLPGLPLPVEQLPPQRLRLLGQKAGQKAGQNAGDADPGVSQTWLWAQRLQLSAAPSGVLHDVSSVFRRWFSTSRSSSCFSRSVAPCRPGGDRQRLGSCLGS